MLSDTLRFRSGELVSHNLDSKNAEIRDQTGKVLGTLSIGAKGYRIALPEIEPETAAPGGPRPETLAIVKDALKRKAEREKNAKPAALKRKGGLRFLTTRRPDWMRKIEAESVGA